MKAYTLYPGSQSGGCGCGPITQTGGGVLAKVRASVKKGVKRYNDFVDGLVASFKRKKPAKPKTGGSAKKKGKGKRKGSKGKKRASAKK